MFVVSIHSRHPRYRKVDSGVSSFEDELITDVSTALHIRLRAVILYYVNATLIIVVMMFVKTCAK